MNVIETNPICAKTLKARTEESRNDSVKRDMNPKKK